MHLGASRVRVLAHVGEAFLDDAEDLDLLVGRETHRGSISRSTSSVAVGGEEVDVPPQRGVERRVAGSGREREDREARLLLSRLRRLLQLRDRLLLRCAVLEHRRVRRDGEEVLREPVVDLARDAGALFRDRAPELREANRAPAHRRAERRTRACAGSRRCETELVATSGVKT